MFLQRCECDQKRPMLSRVGFCAVLTTNVLTVAGMRELTVHGLVCLVKYNSLMSRPPADYPVDSNLLFAEPICIVGSHGQARPGR